MTTLTSKDPNEFITVVFEFANVTTAPQSPVVTAELESGPDGQNLSAMLSGSASIVGSQVRQKVIQGLNGATYTLKCQVDTVGGMRYIAAGQLPVRTAA